MTTTSRVSTGIAGLDEVLGGGLPPHRLYMLVGDPGAGKTTLGMQFLLEGARKGEQGLYVTLSETAEELESMATSHGWSLDGIAVHELPSFERSADTAEQYTIFQPSEVELTEATRALLDLINRVDATRIVIDSLSELRLLAQEPLRFRRQMSALKRTFAGRGRTVLMLDTDTTDADKHPHTLVHGLMRLQQLQRGYGASRRRLTVAKMRGISFRTGFHDVTIERGGLVVHPRLVAAHHREDFVAATMPSGVPALDVLLGGGLGRGTSSLFLGPAGAGKSTLAAQYAVTTAANGGSVAVYLFDETLRSAFQRPGDLTRQLREHLDGGRITMQSVDTAELSPGEFACAVRREVERRNLQMVVIDSLNGYLTSMPEEDFLMLHLHELLSYLNQRGVLTLLLMAQFGVLGEGVDSPVNVTYLADSVVLLRYFEHEGSVRQAISVVKKRGGDHERTIREFRIDANGIGIGPPLDRFRGVLTGTPTYHGSSLGAAADGVGGAHD